MEKGQSKERRTKRRAGQYAQAGCRERERMSGERVGGRRRDRKGRKKPQGRTGQYAQAGPKERTEGECRQVEMERAEQYATS